MSEIQPGLRFDIYERIHLDEASPAIHELEEIELVPHIQVITRGDQAILKGNLLLTGIYTGEFDQRNRTLEHLIPVEITLPMSRIKRVEDIMVEIDNFDVDLLSSRSLNVIGVLSLHGIEMVSEEQGGWKEEEETVFLHVANPEQEQLRTEFSAVQEDHQASFFSSPISQYPSATTPAPTPTTEPTAAQSYDDYESVRTSHPYEAPPSSQPWPIMNFEQPIHQSIEAPEHPLDIRAEQPLPQSSQQFGDVSSSVLEHATSHSPENAEKARTVLTPEPAKELFAEPAAVQKPTAEPAPVQIAAPIQEQMAEPVYSQAAERADVKIAFSGKSTEPEVKPSHGLQSLIHKAEEVHEPEQRLEQIEEDRTTENKSNTIEWKKLYMNKESDQPFRKLRLVIVQKEETLETIAVRYNVSAKSLQLLNRLGDMGVSSGQVIHIPR